VHLRSLPSLLFNVATTDKVVFREIGLCPLHTADATKQFRRVGVGGVYWALGVLQLYSLFITPHDIAAIHTYITTAAAALPLCKLSHCNECRVPR